MPTGSPGPATIPRSSWAAHALGRGDPLVTDHPLYCALGESGAARQSAYRALPPGAGRAFPASLRLALLAVLAPD